MLSNFRCSFTTILAWALLWGAEAQYSSYDYGPLGKTLLARQTTPSPIVTTGVHTGAGVNGSLPLRIEVRELEQNQNLWTLYILGLDFMMRNTSEADMESWYQISGIHGRPFTPYDNVVSSPPGNEEMGYCNHVSILFPTWHRPLLALFEQVLYGIIQNIASMYPEEQNARATYTAAAADFRIPYWDWTVASADGSVLPSSTTIPYIDIDGPYGTQTIWNPLSSYPFQLPLNTTDLPDFPFTQYVQTVRWPTSQAWNASSQNDLVAAIIKQFAGSLQARLYTLFTNYPSYADFSNEAWFNTSDNPMHYDSIESVHGTIHTLVGNGGHMTYVDYAGFDPIFWLHHAMLDRCFAIWEVLNYNASDSNTYVTPEPSRYGTYTTEVNATQDITSPLTPFHKNATGEFWTSADVPTTDVFGYAYPETASYEGQNATANVIAAINRLYGPKVTAGAINPTGMVVGRAITPVISNATGQYTHWIANIKVSKHALGAPFFIHLFIGIVNSNTSSWQFDPNLVGTQGIFVGAGVCDHCDATKMVSATLPMTDALRKHVDNEDLRSLDPDDVDAYLAGRLQYRVTLVNNTVIENGDSRLDSLTIDVAYAQVQTAGVNELPTWGDPKISFSMGAASALKL